MESEDYRENGQAHCSARDSLGTTFELGLRFRQPMALRVILTALRMNALTPKVLATVLLCVFALVVPGTPSRPGGHGSRSAGPRLIEEKIEFQKKVYTYYRP